jgi:hypothetical protein
MIILFIGFFQMEHFMKAQRLPSRALGAFAILASASLSMAAKADEPPTVQFVELQDLKLNGKSACVRAVEIAQGIFRPVAQPTDKGLDVAITPCPDSSVGRTRTVKFVPNELVGGRFWANGNAEEKPAP